MNTVVPLHNKANYFPQDSELYFDTFERPLAFLGGHEGQYKLNSHKAIVRMVQGTHAQEPKAIGIVGKNYKVLPMKDLCQHVEDTFCSVMTKEQLEGAQTIDGASYNGGICMRQYIFPNITEDIGSTSSKVGFRTIITNGYDGSSPIKFYSGAIDFFCTNGMVSGVYDLVSKKHTSGLTITGLTSKLEKSIEIFYKQSKVFKHWVGKSITDEEALSFFKSTSTSERRAVQLYDQYQYEKLTHGPTVWALYSAATYYATHDIDQFKVRDTGNDNKVITLLNRERQVRSWLNTPEFEKLAA